MIRLPFLGKILIKNHSFLEIYMAKNKGTRILITLECTECRSNENKRSAGVSRYTTEKNRRNTPERLELKKYCSHCNSSTIHKEIK